MLELMHTLGRCKMGAERVQKTNFWIKVENGEFVDAYQTEMMQLKKLSF